jgi:hypothetical protein
VPQAAWRSFGAKNTVRHICGISTIVCGAVHAADGQPEHPDSFNTGASNAAALEDAIRR